jgi:DNA-binding NarL/FixJ family response regulator
MTTIRVLLVDDAPQVRAGLRTLLPLLAEADGLALEIAGEASDGAEALRQVATLRPDVVCLDLEMPKMDGLAATAAIKARWPATRVVAFSVHGDADVVQRARAAGVDEFVVKGAALQGLIRSLRDGALPHHEDTKIQSL